jgi:hypothetical protein
VKDMHQARKKSRRGLQKKHVSKFTVMSFADAAAYGAIVVIARVRRDSKHT